MITRKLKWANFLLGLFKLHQKYADGQNDPEWFSVSSAFPMARFGFWEPCSLLQTPSATVQHSSLSTRAAPEVSQVEYQTASTKRLFLLSCYYIQICGISSRTKSAEPGRKQSLKLGIYRQMAIPAFVQLDLQPLYDFSRIFSLENTIPSKRPFWQLFLFYDVSEGKKTRPTERIVWTGVRSGMPASPSLLIF